MHSAEYIIKKFKEVHSNNEFDYSKSVYAGYNSKLTIICNKHNVEFEIAPAGHLKGTGCPECSKEKRNKSNGITREEFLSKVYAKHGDKFIFKDITYTNSDSEISCTCSNCKNTFSTKARNFIRFDRPCIFCGTPPKTYSTEDFIKKYKYKNPESTLTFDNFTYIDSKIPSEVVCEKHGIVLIPPNRLLLGHGCPKCGEEKRPQSRINSSKSSFESRARLVHGDKYGYDNVNYIKGNKLVEIYCEKHQEYFSQTPSYHLTGSGCPKCSSENFSNITRSNKEEFVLKAEKIHNKFYSYENVIYEKSDKKVEVTCPLHDSIWISPAKHLQGKGCKKCANMKNSEYLRNNPNGWGYGNWEKSALKSKHFDGYKVYIVELWNKEEKFIKIGRTFQTIKKRFSHTPYFYTVLNTIVFKDARECCEAELNMKNKYKDFKYNTKIPFDGQYECFNISIKDVIINEKII